MKDFFDIDTSNPEEVKRIALCLVIECPIGGNPESCPFFEIRKLHLKDRIAWVNKRDYHDHLEIYLHHKQCLAKSEKGIS